MKRDQQSLGRSRRRAFLASTASIGAAGLAGCFSLLGNDEDSEDEFEFGQVGSGVEGRDISGGTSIDEMDALEGELTIYSGRNEFLVGPLIEELDNHYDGFTPEVRYGDSTDLVNQIQSEGDGSSADVFFSVNAGALGALADAGRTQSLSGDVTEMVREEFRTDQWVGTSGRIRSVPYNTDVYSASDLPSSIDAYADFEGQLGWAPGYGSCQAFVTAMRLLEGEEATRQWLQSVQDSGIQRYSDELAVCDAIAAGEIDAGLTNHYYVQRVLDGSPDAPIATAFTEGDAGATFNVAGAAVVDATGEAGLAENFVRHLLSSEAQDYFARETFEYPTIPDMEPVGELPAFDELDTPSEIDLTQLSDLQPTVDLMRDVGIEV